MKARTILVIVFLQRNSNLMWGENTIKLENRSLEIHKRAGWRLHGRGQAAHFRNPGSAISAQSTPSFTQKPG
jgi:hypothetical protein